MTRAFIPMAYGRPVVDVEADAEASTPIEPAKMAHWLAILSVCREDVRVWADALCAVEGPGFLRNLIKHFSLVSVPTAVASLTFQFHRARGNSKAARSAALPGGGA